MYRSKSMRRVRDVLPQVFVLLFAAASVRSASAVDEHFGVEPVRFINEQIAAGWSDAGLQPSAAATDGEWCRRVFLDLVGRIPSLTELDRYVQDSTPTKRAELVERLLGEEYEDEFARNWTDVWTMVLIGRDTENEQVSRWVCGSGCGGRLRRTFRTISSWRNW